MNTPRLPSRQMCIIGGVIFILLAAIGILGWNYYALKHEREALSADTAIIRAVGELYELPTDELPAVVKIEDKGELDNQAFYSKAKNGDYVLVYTKNKLALIYREKNNKLINVGPVNFTSEPGR